MTNPWSTGERMALWQRAVREAIVDTAIVLPSDRIVSRTHHGWLGEVVWIAGDGLRVAAFTISTIGPSRTCVTMTEGGARLEGRRVPPWLEALFQHVADGVGLGFSPVHGARAAIFKKGRRSCGSDGSSD